MLAAYLYVEEASPDAGRLTRDIDVVIRREDIAAIATTVMHLDLSTVTPRDLTCLSSQQTHRRGEQFTLSSTARKFARNIRSQRRKSALAGFCKASV